MKIRWLSAGLCVLCQCTGTETGNPIVEQEARVAFAPLSATVTRREFGDISFERVAIHVASVALEACDGGAQAVLLQNRSLDLLGGALSAAQIPAGTYCSIRVTMGSNSDSFAASRMVSGGKTSLTFESQLRARVRLELLEPLVTNAAAPRWILGVDLTAWLDPIGAWLNSDDLKPMLDDPQTMALRRAQAHSLRLYEDIDSNGRLEREDLDTPLSEPGALLR